MEEQKILNQNIHIIPTDISQEMKDNYINYSMSVIVARALPDVRDGLKPVHRKILYAMHEMNLHHNGPFKKCAKTVGEVIGKYHPHGDVAVYDSLVRMAQDFSMRYPLIEGQGNFGSVDGDPPAAMRYCLTGDTLVITDKGLKPIKDIGPQKGESIDINILSKGKTVNHASKWFDSGIHPTIKIETRQGFSLQGSYNHPVLIWQKTSQGKPDFEWKLLSDIKIGDRVVLDRTDDLLWPEKEISTKKYLPKVQVRTGLKTVPKYINSDIAHILGSLTAEGTLNKENELEFYNSDNEWIQEFTTRFTTAFSNCRLHTFSKNPVSYGKKPYKSIEIHSQYIVEFLHNLGLSSEKSAFRKIPQTILESPKHVVSSFLKAYFEGDGTITTSNEKFVELSCVSKSEELLKQIQILLLRFGILSTKRFDRARNIHKLYIRGYKNYKLFDQNIGFISQRKNTTLKKVINSHYKDFPLYDYVPFIKDYITENIDETLPYEKVRAFVYNHNFDRYSPMESNYEKVLESVIYKTQSESEELFESLLENNYIFDSVTSIEQGGMQKVYSIKVDSECHSFISNGFISHNTESRLAKTADEMLRDLDKESVDFIENYDGSEREPVVLPALLPNLLLNGADGIAVGMATKIPTHNLGEVVNACISMIEGGNQYQGELKRGKYPRFETGSDVKDLMKHIKGPDFPTGGIMYNKEDILNIYATGRGRVVVRAVADIAETKSGKAQIIITQLPYQVNKARLASKIADLVKNERLKGISDIRDESNREGMRLVIDIKKDGNPKNLLNLLYKYTEMQSAFNANMLALVDGEPKVLTLKDILEEFVTHRQEIVIRRTEFDLRKAKERAHILEGLKIAIDNLDEVISIIRNSANADVAKSSLIERFSLSEIQSQAILDMQLRRLAALERQKIEEELKQVLALIKELEEILSTPQKILDIIKGELIKLRDEFSDPRRTKVIAGKIGEIEEEDTIVAEDTIITISKKGYIKRINPNTYKIQNRGGKGVMGMKTKEEDNVSHVILSHTHDDIFFFTNKGKVYKIRVYEIDEGSRSSKGQSLMNLINIESGELVTSVLTRGKHGIMQESVNLSEQGGTSNEDVKKTNYKYLFMVTKNGTVKKTITDEFNDIRKSGVIAIVLEKSDELIWVKPTSGEDDIILATKKAHSIRFKEGEVRATGRATMGVKGITLDKEDIVIGMDVVSDNENYLFSITEKGFGKITSLKEYSTQGRGGRGVLTARITSKTGNLVNTRVVDLSSMEMIILSKKGHAIRLDVKNIPSHSRQTSGVRLMRLPENDQVAAITIL